MTKEELAEEIESKGVEYADSINYTIPKFSDENGYCWGQVEEAYEKGALDFAEPREKRIEELEQKIEKMKRCGNCSHFKQKTYRGEYHTQCDFDWDDVYGEYEACDKWEIEEND